MNFAACSSFIQVDEADLYTVLCLPAPDGKYPVVLFRTPYDDAMSKMGDAEIQLIVLQQQREWLENGYAVVWQHCRGTGRSTGDCIPYRNERKDGLALQQWVRQQPFYNGEIYLCGGSYLSSVHYLTAPFAPDIRGAVLRIQDTERYNVCYRNGFFKCGLHGSWYVGMYKKKSLLQKNYTDESFQLLPMEDFSKTVFGEDSPDLDQTLAHPRRDDPFWQTPLGGSEAHNAVANAGIPILLTTGFYDIYTGGIFDMWNAMDDATRAISALAVCPYDHSCTETNQPVAFEHGRFEDVFGIYAIRWINSIRGKEAPPFEPGASVWFSSKAPMVCGTTFSPSRIFRRIMSRAAKSCWISALTNTHSVCALANRFALTYPPPPSRSTFATPTKKAPSRSSAPQRLPTIPSSAKNPA